jgi:hypothetical protein
MAFLTRNKAKLCKTLTIKLVLEKNANFRRKLKKIAEIMIITYMYMWMISRKLRFQGLQRLRHGDADHGVRLQDLVRQTRRRRHPLLAVQPTV